jgi:hypothetical protein
MRSIRRAVGTAVLAVLALVTAGHVGSPDTWFQGEAGPYPVKVVVRLPGVIPGLAQIDIGVTGDDVTRVTAQPIIFDAGKEGAPPPDEARPVPGRPGTYHAQLWFMTSGSFSVNVEVTGGRGKGTAIVPVAAVAERQIGLYPWLGALLLALGTFLFVGALTIFRAAATDGVVAPGELVEPARRRKGLATMAFGAGLLTFILWGGRNWWAAVEREYRDELYRPFQAAAEVTTRDGGNLIRFSITDSVWSTRRARNRWERFSVSPLVPDHGKLMHMFVIREADQAALAHLHPVSTDSTTFEARLGALPAGRYRVYADVVHETGFPQTMVASVSIPAPAADSATLTDPDDAVFVGPPTDDSYTLPDGATVTREASPDGVVANEDAGLRFTIREPDGATARLEPYLGMAGHAVVERSDGSVYVHLHPAGTISMVAQAALGGRQRSDTVPGMLARRLTAEAGAAAHAGHPTFGGTVSFPYAFPKPGDYRVWFQFRRGTGIATAPFTVRVR